MDIDDLLRRAGDNASFRKIHETFGQANIQNWLLEEEKKLLFAVGAFAPGNGIVVEIGSFQGGSATFFAAGIAERGTGRLYCIDPHLGAPPWLGVAPHQGTFSIFQEKLRYCGVEQWVTPRVGESSAVAAVWPALPIDAVFIDGDHSFRGALRDFENWLPKTKTGGLIVVDDADDPVLTELLDFIEFIKTVKSVSFERTIQGMAVFQRTSMEPWEAMAELSVACAKRKIYRPWDYTVLHNRHLPQTYAVSRSWSGDHGLDIAYQLCYLARCGPAPYGYTQATQLNDREILYTLERDRTDGEVSRLSLEQSRSRRYRAILCLPSEAIDFAPLLMPGGVLITREQDADSIATRNTLLAAGLDGCGYDSSIHWGIWQPSYLSAEAVIDYSFKAFES